MSTASSMDPNNLPWETIEPPDQKPMTSLAASARRITSKTATKGRVGATQSWQNDAWDMFDLVGEQRFLATTLAGRMGQARFYVGERSDNPEEIEPELTEDQTALDIFSVIGGGPVGLAAMVVRLGVNLFVAGDGYIVGLPKKFIPDEWANTEGQPPPTNAHRPTSPMPDGAPQKGLSVDLADLSWRMLSVNEVSISASNELSLHLGEVSDTTVAVNPDELLLIRVWRGHPRRAWEAESPTRSSLPVLRELVGLTMHISAQIDSRLAGAGLLLVPEGAQRALKQAAGMDDDSDDDVFTEALMDAMMTPITDRSSAAAVVPLVTVVPDETIEKFKHMKFSSDLDAEARELREEAIRRLALGQDAPPELLLGVASMNHWGAWLVREDVVKTHIEPHLALICDALTSQYLRPMLMEFGYSQEQADKFEIWYDVSHMISRPNRSTDAQSLHDKGAISDSALREANGFTDDDADKSEHLDMATSLALDFMKTRPELIGNLQEVVDSIRAVLAAGMVPGEDAREREDSQSPGEIAEGAKTAAEREADRTDPIDEVPDTDGNDAPNLAMNPYTQKFPTPYGATR